MKKLLTSLLVILIIGTVFAGGVFAHGSQSRMNSGNYQSAYNRQGEYQNNFQSLDLSEEQINEIADLREDFYEQSESLRDQMRELNRELRDLEFRGASYEETGKIEDKMEAILVQIDEKRIALQEKIEAVLTEEQLQLIEENRLNYGSRSQDRFNNEFGPRHHMGYGRNEISNRDYGHHGFDGYGFGMMRNSRRFRTNGGFGFGAGWCH